MKDSEIINNEFNIITDNIEISSLEGIEGTVIDEEIVTISLNDNSIIESEPELENNDNVNENSNDNLKNDTTALIEYKEIDEPCVALTIIGENRLTNTEIFIKRGFKFSFKAFFSTLVLTIMNMFI